MPSSMTMRESTRDTTVGKGKPLSSWKDLVLHHDADSRAPRAKCRESFVVSMQITCKSLSYTRVIMHKRLRRKCPSRNRVHDSCS